MKLYWRSLNHARELEKEIEDSGEFCKHVYSILAKIDLRLEEGKHGVCKQTPVKNQEISNTGNTESAKVKLPKIELKSFSGNYQEWQGLWDTFQSAVDGNTSILAIEKFTYQGPVSRNSRKVFGPEKPLVKLRPTYSVKLVFSYIVKGMKIKITAKFRASKRLRFEDRNRISRPEMRPKSFGTFEKQAPGRRATSFPGSLFSASIVVEKRPWLSLVTCLPESGRFTKCVLGDGWQCRPCRHCEEGNQHAVDFVAR